MYDTYNNVSEKIGSFKGKFPLPVKEGTKPYQASTWSMAYAPHKTLKICKTIIKSSPSRSQVPVQNR